MENALLKSSHATALPATAGGAPDWIQILPAGSFTGRDGRGPHRCDPERVIARTRTYTGPVDIPVDYDHQLEHAAKNGRSAPASGWITALEARKDGVWGKVEWTEKGRASVESREYRYVSPVYFHTREGTVQAVESVALTNMPNLTGLKALASREPGPYPFTGEETMPFLKTMASVLGVTDAEPAEAAVETAARALVLETQGLRAAMSALAQTVGAADGAPANVIKAAQSVASRAEHPDLAKYVPVDTFHAVNTELAAMKAAQSAVLVEDAMKSGKVTPAMESWAKTLASRDPEAFKTFLETAPDLRPGGGKDVSAAKSTPPEDGKGALSASAKAICSVMGISEEEYRKTAPPVRARVDDNGDAE